MQYEVVQPVPDVHPILHAWAVKPNPKNILYLTLYYLPP